MNRHALECFYTVGKELNLTSAAKQLLISRQALSASIRKLENQLGVILLERSRTGVTLTEAGEALQEYIANERLLWNKFQNAIGVESETCCISFGGTLEFIPKRTMEAILDFQNQRPDITVIPQEHNDMEQLYNSVLSNQLDVAWGFMKPTDEALGVITGSPISANCIMKSSDPLAALDVIDFNRDLAGRTLLVFSSGAYNLLYAKMREAGITYQAIPAVYSTIAHKMTDGDSLFLGFNNTNPIPLDDLASKRIVNFPYELHSHIVYRKKSSINVFQFIDYIAPLFGASSPNAPCT